MFSGLCKNLNVYNAEAIVLIDAVQIDGDANLETVSAMGFEPLHNFMELTCERTAVRDQWQEFQCVACADHPNTQWTVAAQ